MPQLPRSPIIPKPSGSPMISRNRLSDLGRYPSRSFEVSYTAWEEVGDPGSIAAGTAVSEFLNGWVNVLDGYPPAAFHKTEDGKVWLRGAITGGALGTAAFTLPEWARPEYPERFFVATDLAGVGAAIQVLTSGDVFVIG